MSEVGTVDVDVAQFLVYLFPGYLTAWIWRQLTEPPEHRTTEAEVIGSWIIASVPTVLVVNQVLRFFWGIEVTVDSADEFLRSLDRFVKYAVVTTVVSVILAGLATRFSPCLWRIVNWSRERRGLAKANRMPSVWAIIANQDAKDTSLEVEVKLPDGRTVRGQIKEMNEGDRAREMLLVECRELDNEENEETENLPDLVYVNVDTGQVFPIWKHKEEKEADAPQQGARSPENIKGNSTQQPWPVGNTVLLGLLILLIALVGLALGLISLSLVFLFQLLSTNNLSFPSGSSLLEPLLFWGIRALVRS